MTALDPFVARFAERWGPKEIGPDWHLFLNELRELIEASHAPAPQGEPGPALDSRDSIDALELPVRALGGLCRGLEDQSGVSYWDARRLPWRAILDLYPRRIKNFGAISFVQVCEALHYRGLADDELRQSRWWISAQSPWRSRWRVRRESITGEPDA